MDGKQILDAALVKARELKQSRAALQAKIDQHMQPLKYMAEQLAEHDDRYRFEAKTTFCVNSASYVKFDVLFVDPKAAIRANKAAYNFEAHQIATPQTILNGTFYFDKVGFPVGRELKNTIDWFAVYVAEKLT